MGVCYAVRFTTDHDIRRKGEWVAAVRLVLFMICGSEEMQKKVDNGEETIGPVDEAAGCPFDKYQSKIVEQQQKSESVLVIGVTVPKKRVEEWKQSENTEALEESSQAQLRDMMVAFLADQFGIVDNDELGLLLADWCD